MALVKELLNLGSCGAGAAIGLNVSKGCIHILRASQTIGLMLPGTYLDPEREFNLEYVQELQEEGKVSLLTQVRTFEENGSDDAVETLEDDTQFVTNEGKYKFLCTYTKGLFFNKGLHSLKGFGNYSTFFIDKEGNIFMTERLGGGAKGFTTGMIQPAKLQFPSNTVGQKEGLMFQLLERFEVDSNYVFIDSKTLDFDPRQLEDSTEVSLSYVNDPSNADTTITFKAVLAQDNKTPLEGLESNDLEFTVDGVSQSITPVAVAGKPGEYTATVTALATSENTRLRLYNTTDSRSIINKDSSLYKSATLAKLVV